MSEENETCKECGSENMIYLATYADDDDEWFCKDCKTGTHDK